MKNLIILLVLSLFIFKINAQTGTFTDSRDDYLYKTVKIGNQIWMAENLRANTFRNGDSIVEFRTKKEWKRGKGPGLCYYDNDPKNKLIYGCLYNRSAVNLGALKGLCPEGWHIPSFNEIEELQNYLGGEKLAGAKMKSIDGWEKSDVNNTNSCGFNGLPSGIRLYNGQFQSISYKTNFWTRTINTQVHGQLIYNLYFSTNSLTTWTEKYDKGMCVRCIQD